MCQSEQGIKAMNSIWKVKLDHILPQCFLIQRKVWLLFTARRHGSLPHCGHTVDGHMTIQCTQGDGFTTTSVYLRYTTLCCVQNMQLWIPYSRYHKSFWSGGHSSIPNSHWSYLAYASNPDFCCCSGSVEAHPWMRAIVWTKWSGGFSAGSGMRKGWFSRYQLSTVSDLIVRMNGCPILCLYWWHYTQECLMSHGQRLIDATCHNAR